MKGISTILAMILIVIIVVALIGMTYTFAVGLFSSTATTTENQTAQITGNMGKTIAVVSARCVAGTGTAGSYSVVVRNTGNAAITANEIAVTADGALLTLSSPAPLPVGNTVQYTSVGMAVTATTHNLVVSSPAGNVEEKVTC